MINAVFADEQGVRFNRIFHTKKKFLSYVGRSRDEFIHATDYISMEAVYPSSLPEYRRL